MNLVQDVRFAFRMMAKSPGFTAVVILTLALGIGANTTVFTLVNAVLFRGMPFDRPDEIVGISGRNFTKKFTQTGVSFPDFADLRAKSKSFRDLALYSGIGVNLSNEGNVPERYSGARVGVNLFPMLGVQPIVGRSFTEEDGKPGAGAAALISNAIWKSRYGGANSVIGRVVRINDVPTTIVGVMPPDMNFPSNQDIWVALVPNGTWEKRDVRDFNVVARLKDGVSMSAARAELDLLASNLGKEYPATNKAAQLRVQTMNEVMNGGPIRNIFLALLGAVGFVLLIACANVANLLLSRSIARAREVSIRTALGASRWRIIRQLLVECLLLSTAGAVLGFLIALWGVRVFDAAVVDSGKPYWVRFYMDSTVFLYVAGMCLASSFLFGLFPALQTTRVDLNTVLKEGGRGTSGSRSRWLSEALVAGELALAMILLVGAGLMMRSFLNLYQIDSIDRPENVLQMRMSLALAKYPKPEQRAQFFDRLLLKLQTVPGSEGVALASDAPLQGAEGWRFELEG
ncbi:MAG: ABC transporter permease, partial [Bryobacteraceae bacterium]